MHMENLIKKSDLLDYISEDKMVRNIELVSDIRKKLRTHEVFSHPILSAIKETYDIPLNMVCSIHYDYRHAIVQIFTDALLAALQTSYQLENLYELPPGAKMIPRFLLTPNMLDEFGFKIQKSSLVGTVSSAHYPLFEEIMQIFPKNNMEVSIISQKLRSFLENNYHDYANIITLLALVELQVIKFTPILEKILHKHYSSNKFNYYTVHGNSSDSNKTACDDEHENALWESLALVIDKVDIKKLLIVTNSYLDLWNDFWSIQFSTINSFREIEFTA